MIFVNELRWRSVEAALQGSPEMQLMDQRSAQLQEHVVAKPQRGPRVVPESVRRFYVQSYVAIVKSARLDDLRRQMALERAYSELRPGKRAARPQAHGRAPAYDTDSSSEEEQHRHVLLTTEFGAQEIHWGHPGHSHGKDKKRAKKIKERLKGMKVSFDVLIPTSKIKQLIADCLEYQLAWPQIEKGRPFRSPALQALRRELTER